MRFPALPLGRTAFLVLSCLSLSGYAQTGSRVQWRADGNAYYRQRNGAIEEVTLPDNTASVVVPHDKLQPPGSAEAVHIRDFSMSADDRSILIYTNTRKVWRYDTRGDYWIYQRKDSSFVQLGRSLPPSSLMFAKISPDGTQAAYVSQNNLFVEDLATHHIRQLTTDGTRQRINGTFDYLYEEEFDCRDGFRWSPDSKRIAYWQIDARAEKDYSLLNTTDSIYPFVVPVAYGLAGEKPAAFRIGVADIASGQTRWLSIPTDTPDGGYAPRMEWAAGNDQLIIQYLNRLQNHSRLLLCNLGDGGRAGGVKTVYTEQDAAWIDIQSAWDEGYAMGGWDWIREGKEYIWASEKDGWRHLYRVSRDGGKETLLTPGSYDVMRLCRVDEAGGYVYFMASPGNATQAYLYRVGLGGGGEAERVTPTDQAGTHQYDISPNARYALHTLTSHYIYPVREWIRLDGHQALAEKGSVRERLAKTDSSKTNIRFFTIKTTDGTALDAWMMTPERFDSTKRYPVVFFVYGGPAQQTVTDEFGRGSNWLYKGSMAADGYIYVSIDNRGTPAAKGRAWRKSIYGRLGQLDVTDQAEAAQQIRRWAFVDSTRIAVWGWSNGGTEALNLLFRYPNIYGTAIAIAPITDFRLYDNIYTERVMGLPRDNDEAYVKGSPLTYAKALQGNLLLIQGSGDDNVHYAHTERLLDELIRYGKVFQFMEYPNRTHDISEGPGTSRSLSLLYTAYLQLHCPGGGR